MSNIEKHTSRSGETYYSMIDDEGQTVFSFDIEFEDCWTNDDENTIDEGSTPSKI